MCHDKYVMWVSWCVCHVGVVCVMVCLLCLSGKAGDFIDKGDNTYGGKYVVNPSGGLISKGHPLGATGVCVCV